MVKELGKIGPIFSKGLKSSRIHLCWQKSCYFLKGKKKKALNGFFMGSFKEPFLANKILKKVALTGRNLESFHQQAF